MQYTCINIYVRCACVSVCLCVCTHVISLCVFDVSPCSITTPTVQTAGELEGLQTDLWVLSASSSVSIRVVIESCEFVSLTQIYWNDILSLSALGTNFRLHFKTRAVRWSRAKLLKFCRDLQILKYDKYKICGKKLMYNVVLRKLWLKAGNYNADQILKISPPH